MGEWVTSGGIRIWWQVQHTILDSLALSLWVILSLSTNRSEPESSESGVFGYKSILITNFAGPNFPSEICGLPIY